MRVVDEDIDEVDDVSSGDGGASGLLPQPLRALTATTSGAYCL